MSATSSTCVADTSSRPIFRSIIANSVSQVLRHQVPVRLDHLIDRIAQELGDVWDVHREDEWLSARSLHLHSLHEPPREGVTQVVERERILVCVPQTLSPILSKLWRDPGSLTPCVASPCRAAAHHRQAREG